MHREGLLNHHSQASDWAHSLRISWSELIHVTHLVQETKPCCESKQQHWQRCWDSASRPPPPAQRAPAAGRRASRKTEPSAPRTAESKGRMWRQGERGQTGFAINMDNPREVGADRLVNAVAAHDRFGGPGVVVDFGTSTNFDVYTADATFIGGVIAPGVMLSMEALSSRGAQLPKFELRRPRSAIGRNTVEAMQSGAVFGFAGQVDRIVEEILEVLGGDAVVVATGGLASAIVEECSTIDEHDPWLTLSGLRLIWERNTT